MERKKVYLLLTDTGSMLTKMIKLYTKKPYNHASIAFDEQFAEVYSFGRKKPRNPFIGGFVNEDVRQGIFINARCAIYSCEVTEEQIQKMRAFIEQIEKDRNRYRYNFLGLFSFIVNKPLNRKNAYFCSEFVAEVLNEGGIIRFEKPLCLISPHDIQCIHTLKLEYEGQLAELFGTESSKSYSFIL
ncbi:hypothetical protein [Lysinibacillus antri]|uniref:Uncharacterized protein n=1 Tax=Lysinibacillus antri TaxID=2498145 RepID=A0A3S0P8B5_9BACI|nr:hypothetical protein [Lysinibacillus antri]RUL53562.1 hypothetical protein EK386_08320 [Lysinibacillus antri]